ncbi:hypothetical protein CAPTEDRAFT_102108 [Capitella teleta]|uniref:Uncharacterized protein n=1 Tax=Capitella teleta TaxID=283909 RepID=R7UZ95_CAPTE|nr:hypothetical protein CAPTEDRAFT_102108 [Capitella teleta]|eukprot:ELU09277.1 hypothetical protein CAPTEDRAFT_102108 [Capitella teleta]
MYVSTVISRFILFSNTFSLNFLHIAAHEDLRVALYKFLCRKRHRKHMRSNSTFVEALRRLGTLRLILF